MFNVNLYRFEITCICLKNFGKDEKSLKLECTAKVVNTAPDYYNVDDTCSFELTQSMSLMNQNWTFEQDSVQFTGIN